MSVEELKELTKNYNELKESIDFLGKQYRELKHSTGNMSQGVKNTQTVLHRLEPVIEKLYEKMIEGSEYNNLATIKVLKSQGILIESVNKRLLIVEKNKRVHEKIVTCKKVLFGLTLGFLGSLLYPFIKPIVLYVLSYFKNY